MKSRIPNLPLDRLAVSNNRQSPTILLYVDVSRLNVNNSF